MKQTLVCVSILLAFACAEEKEFKGSTSIGQKKADVRPQDKSDVSPAPSPASPEPSSDSILENTRLSEGSQEFDIEKNTGKEVDMFWVIDNSPSMAEEISLVRKNFTTFMSSISNRLDIKMSLISRHPATPDPFSGELNPKLAMDLSPDAKAAGHVQIDKDIGSFDPVNSIAGMICPVGSSKIPANGEEAFQYLQTARSIPKPNAQESDLGTYPDSPYQLCGKQVTDGIEISDFGNFGLKPFLGKANFRLDATKVIVFVTDDNALTALNPDEFEKTLGLAAGSLRVFGFLGVPKVSTCRISSPGYWYEAAAKATGGQLFNICEGDWTANFAKLSENVVSIASSSFRLEQKFGLSVKRVSVDGLDVSSDAYIFDGMSVRILNADLLKAAKKLRVEFSFQEKI